MTILQLAANRWWTGSADSIVTLCRGLRERGHRVMLAMIRGDRFEAKAREAGIEPLTAVTLEAKRSPEREGSPANAKRPPGASTR